MRKRKGLTAIELIVAVAVMAILLTATFTQFRSGEGRTDLDTATSQVLGHVVLMQQRAGANIVECASGKADYGVELDLDAGTYLAFANCDMESSFDPAEDKELYGSEAEFLKDNVKIKEFYDGTETLSAEKQTIGFQGLTRDVYVNGSKSTVDRVSFVISLNNDELCARVDVYPDAKAVEANPSPSCEASQYELP